MSNYDRFLSAAAATFKPSAIRQMGLLMTSRTDLISFAPGYPSTDTFDWLDLPEVASRILAAGRPVTLQYGATRGTRKLLEAIAGIMATRQVATDLEQLLVTTGSQQGLDHLGRVLIDPGDVVLVEAPTYTGAITAFTHLQATLVGVPGDAGGLIIDALDETWQRTRAAGRRVRVLYVVPNFQNPTGALMDLERRREVLAWAARRDLLIIEDDPYRDLYFDESPPAALRPMRADDREGRVVYLSTFSKTLAPGLRVGWIDGPAAIVRRVELAKQATDLSAGTLDQQIVLDACTSGLLERHLPRLRAHYRGKRDALALALRQDLGETLGWTLPRGGFFVWAALPPGLDADALVPLAIEQGVLYVSGSAFHVDGGGTAWIRLSFSSPAVERFGEGVRRLGAAIAAGREGAVA